MTSGIRGEKDKQTSVVRCEGGGWERRGATSGDRRRRMRRRRNRASKPHNCHGKRWNRPVTVTQPALACPLKAAPPLLVSAPFLSDASALRRPLNTPSFDKTPWIQPFPSISISKSIYCVAVCLANFLFIFFCFDHNSVAIHPIVNAQGRLWV